MLLCLSYLECACVRVSTHNTAVLRCLTSGERPAMRGKNSDVCFREKAITVTVKGLTCFSSYLYASLQGPLESRTNKYEAWREVENATSYTLDYC